MIKQTGWKNWKLEVTDKIAWLALDKEGSSTNTLNPVILAELEDILTSLSEQANVQGLVLFSAKTNGFIAGADVEQFTRFKNMDEAIRFIRHGQQVCDKIASASFATVALIEGFCLGGGLELALACRYRVAEADAKTRLGLPEVLLGIHPGWGGTVRLPRLIGTVQAMEMILSGKTVSTKVAAKIGLVDVVVPKRHLRRAAEYFVSEQPPPHRPPFYLNLLNNAWVRPLVAKFFRHKLKERISAEHYPAPFAVIDNWEAVGLRGEQPFIAEANSLGKLQMNETAKNLIRVFFLQERLKGQAKGIEFKPQHVHVIGAGTMGGDIAAWCALRGFRVTLQDREPKSIGQAIKRAYELFQGKLKSPRLVQEAMDRLVPDPDGMGVTKADVIIEAIFENLEVKQALFKSLEGRMKPGAILATNTSSIPLAEITRVLQNSERLIGLHFFNPVAKMMLVEVVSDDKTDKTVLQQAASFVRQLDRLPLSVKSSPGFLVNRVLAPYLIEAVCLLEDGVPAAVIDEKAVEFGMPMGPIELADKVGLDICLSVADNLVKHFGGTIPERLRTLVESGHLGRKTGRGFYEYRNGEVIKEKPAEATVSQPVTERLILRMVNEAVACLREQVVADGDLLDAGMIFGTGFAPFRGGPIHYARSEGKQSIITQLQQLQQQCGERFKPDAGWETF